MDKVTDFVNAIQALKCSRVLLLTACGSLLLLAFNVDGVAELIRAAQGR